MALFFDQDWFDARLQERGQTKADLARILSLELSEIEAMWKDQREVRAAEVAALADFFAVNSTEIADRCGISTPAVPDPEQLQAFPDATAIVERLESLNARMGRIERALADIRNLILSQSTGDPQSG